MGTPTNDLRSRATPMVRSPARLIASAAMARRYPHSRLLQSPIAAPTQAAETRVKRTTAHGPMLAKVDRARGLTLHIGSSHEPGTNSDTAEVMLTMAARKENSANTAIPVGLCSPISLPGRVSMFTTQYPIGLGRPRTAARLVAGSAPRSSRRAPRVWRPTERRASPRLPLALLGMPATR